MGCHLSCAAQEFWRRGRDSNPRMMVLQTIPLGHLGTAPLSRANCTQIAPKGHLLASAVTYFKLCKRLILLLRAVFR